MNILIIRFSSIGDIVLTTPVIRCLRSRFPQAKIHYLTKKKFESVLKNNPYIDRIFLLEGDIQPLMLELLKEKYDYVIDLHHNLRTRYVKTLLRQAFNSQVVSYSFPKLNIRKWLLANLKINRMPDKSIVDRYFETVKKLGVTNDGQGLDYFIGSEDEIKKDDLPMSHMLGFAACAIGGQHETKKMPVAMWRELVKSLEFPLVLLGGPEDAAAAEEIRLVDPVKIYNACGKFSLNESANIISRSRFVITHDTGLMHIAAAYKKPIISIWGNTVPEFGMFPYYGYNNLLSNVSPLSHIIQVKKLSCRPCSKIGYKTCPKKHFNCMRKLSVPEIVLKANELMRIDKSVKK
ncbi:MAG: glycosyltransferase family 9 protein [Chitinophagaceae bacterium]|nr:glycosyltransferase family 9 protein [Chitinophagaceae bacterium]